MRCIIAGSGSDIAKGLTERLRRDGWEVDGTKGHSLTVPMGHWDLLILMHGQLDPIGKFFDTDPHEWIGSLMVNAVYPLACLRAAWPNRNPNATVVFTGGPNLLYASPTYSAYRSGKAAVQVLISTLEEEYPGFKFRALHPGVVNTKIHQQTLSAGHRAANYERVQRIVDGTEVSNDHDEVYRRLKALL